MKKINAIVNKLVFFAQLLAILAIGGLVSANTYPPGWIQNSVVICAVFCLIFAFFVAFITSFHDKIKDL